MLGTRMLTRKAAISVLAMACGAGVAVAQNASPTLSVGLEGGPSVTVNAANLAVFQPEPNTVWIVADKRGEVSIPPAASALGAWTIEKLQVSGGSGLRLTGPRPREWGVTGSGGTFTVAMQGGTAPARRLSILALKDGVKLGGRHLTAQSAGGERYVVVPDASAGVAIEGLQGVPFAVRGGAVLASRWLDESAMASSQVAAVQPVVASADKAPEPRTLSLASTPSETRKAVARAMATATIASPSVPTSPASLTLVRPVKLPSKVVSKNALELLPPVSMANLKDENLNAIEPASGPVSGTSGGIVGADAPELYVPGTVLPFVMPEGWRLEGDKAVRDASAAPRSAEVAAAVGSALEGAATAETVATPPADPSVTEPEEDEKPKAEDGHAADSSKAHGEPAPNEHAAAEGHSAEQPEQTEAKKPESAEAEIPLGIELGLYQPGANIEYNPGLQKVRDALLVALQASKGAENNAAVQAARRDMVAFYLSWQRPHEALAEAAQLRGTDGIPADPLGRLYVGMANVAVDRPQEALAALQNISAPFAADAAWWRAAALQQSGRSAFAVREIPSTKGVLPRYPGYLREMLLVNQARAIAAVGGQAPARQVVDAIRSEYPSGTAPAELTRLAGLVRLGTKNDKTGLELLAEAGRSTTDKAAAARAKYDFVQALFKRKELEPRQMISYLESMTYDWRGDALEAEMLRQLGELYVQRADYRSGLTRWQTLVRSFPEAPALESLTERMTEALLAAFDPENPVQYDPLTYLGLYYDFKELLPADERADRVAERVAGLLVKAGLYPRAIPILEPMLRYRNLEAVDRARLVLLLAGALRLNGTPERSVTLLDDNKSVLAVNTVQDQAAQVERARAFLALNRPERADEALKGLPEKIGRDEVFEVAWRLQRWPEVESLARTRLLGATTEQFKTSMGLQTSLMRLAYALGQQGKTADMLTLQRQYAGLLEATPDVDDGVAALAVSIGISSTTDAGQRPLARVAAAVAGLNDLGSVLERRAIEQQRRREEQELYNKKMQYMELLPPPAM